MFKLSELRKETVIKDVFSDFEYFIDEEIYDKILDQINTLLCCYGCEQSNLKPEHKNKFKLLVLNLLLRYISETDIENENELNLLVDWACYAVYEILTIDNYSE